MNILSVIIFGAMTGFIAYKVKASNFSMGWNIYLGVLGAILASCVMAYINFVYNLPTHFTAGFNLFSIAVDVVGALSLIYAPRFYNKTASKFSNSQLLISLINRLRERGLYGHNR